jgi:hypothetical protein
VNDSFLLCCALVIWKCCKCTISHVCYLIFNYSSPPQVTFISLDGNSNGGNDGNVGVGGGGGSFAPYNRQIHGDGRFTVLVAAAAKEAKMDDDSDNNGGVGSFSSSQNNHLIHWEGKFGRGTMDDNGVDDDDNDNDDGSRIVESAPPHNCKFSMLAAAAAAENAGVEDDTNDGSAGAFPFFTRDDRVMQNRHIPTDASFSLLAAIAAEGSLGDDDNAYLNDDHDSTLFACTSPVQDIDDNIESVCHNDDSNEHLIDAILGENCDGSSGEFFTNGLSLSIVSHGHNHRGILETPKRKASFLTSWSGPSAILRALPFIW